MATCSVCGRKKIRHQLYRVFVKTSRGPILDRKRYPDVYCYACRSNSGLGASRVAVAIPGSRVPAKALYRPKPKVEIASPENRGVETIYSDTNETSMPCPICGRVHWDHPTKHQGYELMGLYSCEHCKKTYSGLYAKKRYIENKSDQE